MLELALLVGIVIWLGTKFGDSVGVIALAVLIVGLLIALCSAGRKIDRAHGNFIDYWSRGGPDRK